MRSPRTGVIALGALSRTWRAALGLVGTFALAWMSLILPLPVSAQSSICAEVKIQIDQKVSFERQAFEAVLKIRNGLEGTAVENIRISILIKDMLGVSVAPETFFVRKDEPVDISGDFATGTGSVAPSTTGEAHWLIIPTQGSGGAGPEGVMYQVGATVTYRLAGEDKSVEVIPETITVRPQPKLELDYFLPGEVYADDPLTQDVEEQPVPFTLGVRITNSGAGTASHVKIESAQPRIVENRQGLLIGFQIDGGYVDDRPAQPSLLLDFGTIESGASRVGRWVMTTTLSGTFYDFAAEYTHADELGGALTSLLGSINSHLLTHDVLVNSAGRDEVRDFLAQAVDASDTDTYRVYESEGGSSEVLQEFAPTLNGAVLAFPSPGQGQLVYARRQIGFDGQGRSVSAVRSDGRVVPTANVWFSKRRDAFGEGWLYFLNLFEANPAACGSTCSYTLDFDGASDDNSSIAGSVYVDTNGNGSQDSGEVGLAGVTVTISGAGVLRSVTTATDGTFAFVALPAGTYTLTVGAATDHVDGTHVAGTAGGTVGATSISGINLTEGLSADGYRFAKVPRTAESQADLAVDALSATPSAPQAGKAFTLTLQVVNAGPSSAPARAQLTLSPTLDVLSANPSVGTFNAMNGQWAIGSLAANGVATLEVQVRAASPGEQVIAASVASTDPAIADPEGGNDSASLTVTVRRPSAVNLQAQLKQETRLLVLAQSPPFTVEPYDGTIAERVSLIDGILTQGGIEHIVTQDVDVFRNELRSGRWNTYWLDASNTLLDGDLSREVGLAIRRGDSLLLDGGVVPSEFTEAWTGTGFGRILTEGMDNVSFVSGSYLQSPDLPVQLRQLSRVTTGEVLAVFSNNSPAVILNEYGNGHVLFFGFDLVPQWPPGQVTYPLLAQIDAVLQPPLPDIFTADSYVALSLKAENLSDPVSIEQIMTLSEGMRLLKSMPAPTVTADNSITWHATLAEGGSFESSTGIRLPIEGGTSSIDIIVVETGETTPLSQQALPISVQSTAQAATSALNEISLIILPIWDVYAIQFASDSLNEAIEARDGGDLNEALTQVLAADASLETVTINVSVARIAIARLMQALEREWFVALSTCDPTGTSIVKDRGHTFRSKSDGTGVSELQSSDNGPTWNLGNYGMDATEVLQTVLDANQVYKWTLSYTPEGDASLAVRDGTEMVGYAEYSSIPPSDGSPILGNAIALQMFGGDGSGPFISGRIPFLEVVVSGLNGISLLDTITIGDADTSVTYYGEGLSSGYVMSGTIQVGSPPLHGAFLGFEITSGIVSCKSVER